MNSTDGSRIDDSKLAISAGFSIAGQGGDQVDAKFSSDNAGKWSYLFLEDQQEGCDLITLAALAAPSTMLRCFVAVG